MSGYWKEYQAAEKPPEKKNAPAGKFKSGNVVGVVWENNGKNGLYKTFEIVRKHYNKTTEKWEDYKNFSEADLPDVFAVISQLILLYRVKRGD